MARHLPAESVEGANECLSMNGAPIESKRSTWLLGTQVRRVTWFVFLEELAKSRTVPNVDFGHAMTKLPLDFKVASEGVQHMSAYRF